MHEQGHRQRSPTGSRPCRKSEKGIQPPPGLAVEREREKACGYSNDTVEEFGRWQECQADLDVVMRAKDFGPTKYSLYLRLGKVWYIPWDIPSQVIPYPGMYGIEGGSIPYLYKGMGSGFYWYHPMVWYISGISHGMWRIK